jgi:hypothetical protein
MGTQGAELNPSLSLVRLNPEEDRLTRFRVIPGEEEAMLQVESFNAAALEYLANAMVPIAEEGLELFPEADAQLRPPEPQDLPTPDDAV